MNTSSNISDPQPTNPVIPQNSPENQAPNQQEPSPIQPTAPSAPPPNLTPPSPPVQNQEPTTQTPPAQPNPVPGQGGKKTNIALIIILIVVFLIIIAAIFGYLIIRRVKKSVVNAVQNLPSSSLTTGGYASTPKTSSSNNTEAENEAAGAEQYAQAKDNTPNTEFAIQINNDLKPIFTSLFGGAKLDNWASVSTDSANFGYLTKNSIKLSDYSNLEKALADTGYTKDYNSNDNDGFMITATKGETTLVIHFITSSPNMLVVGAEKSSSQ